jgi:hypothetical protein
MQFSNAFFYVFFQPHFLMPFSDTVSHSDFPAKVKFIIIYYYYLLFGFRFWFRLFTFDKIKIPMKSHTDFVKILMSKLEFWFRFWCQNQNFYLPCSLVYTLAVLCTPLQSCVHPCRERI